MISRLRQLGFVNMQLTHLRTRRQQCATWWHSLAQRERQALMVAALALFAAVLWFGFIRPPLQTIEHWQSELPRLRSESATLDEILQDMQPLQAVSIDPAGQIRQSLDSLLPAGSYQLSAPPAGQGGLQLELDAAPAGPLMAWLQHTTPRLSLTVSAARLQRSSAAGDAAAGASLSGSVRLESAHRPKESQ